MMHDRKDAYVPFSIFSVLVRSAELWTDRPAIIDGHGILSYRDLLAETERVAALLTGYGLREGDGVGVQGRNGRGFIIAVFAAVRCGATVMPIPHSLVRAERKTLLDRTPLHFVIADRECSRGIDEPGKEVEISGGAYFLHATGRSRIQRIIDMVPDAAFVRYTSGTTGQAKGVVLSHRAVYERILAANKGLGLTEADTVLFVLPMAYHFYVSIILYLHCGACIALATDHGADSLVEMIARHGATFFYASPLHYRMLAASRPEPGRLAALRLAVATSTGLSREVADDFHRVSGIRITQAYGIIEIGLPVINFLDRDTSPQAIGHPLPDYDVAVLDETGENLAPGEVGHLAMKGPGMFSAYLDPFRRREEVLVNGWFMTGDMASRDDTGTITVQGRKKSMINVCGEKVFPEEVENILNAHHRVAESFVYGAEHPRMGETVHAQIVLQDDAGMNAEELRGYVRTRLSPFKVPQQILFVDHIAKTSSGKAFRRGAERESVQ